MKYLFRLIAYLAVMFFVFSAGTVLFMRFVPVTITSMKLFRLKDNYKEYGLRVYSNWRSLDRIDSSLANAVIASEDNNFLHHSGFDWEAIQKARERNDTKSGKRKLGASTITMQAAKNIFCPPSRTWARKGLEAYYTLLIELMWPKHRIMEVYLNLVETRPNVYGAQATAKRFYKKDASQLNAYESAMIATVLPSPARMNLGAPSRYMTSRAGTIRQNMRNLKPEMKMSAE